MDIPKETRRESYNAAKQDAAARRRVVYEILKERGGMTAREVAAELHRRGITATDERKGKHHPPLRTRKGVNM